MSGGWVPCNADWWEQVAAALTATGQPWPEAAVLMDLRWWDDRERMSGGRKPRPGRAVLQARWNLTERPTRRLMADVEAWRDPAQADLRPELSVPRAPQPRPSNAPATPSERPATVPAAAPEHRPAQQGCPADAQATPRACPPNVPSVKIHPHPHRHLHLHPHPRAPRRLRRPRGGLSTLNRSPPG